MQERRRYIRYHPDLTVKYIYVRGMIAIEQDTKLEDLSINGLRLGISSVVRKGDIFLVEMPLPLIGIVSAIVRVIWIKPDDLQQAQNHSLRSGSGQAGVEFDWVSDINRLAEYMQRIQEAEAA